ncbi:MAG: hypothetical protein DCE90_08655 [Pseudanabaena sp.]|nr:MAG: hypothetical protein DCE90_08655 [Pseudanabaena sp.]
MAISSKIPILDKFPELSSSRKSLTPVCQSWDSWATLGAEDKFLEEAIASKFANSGTVVQVVARRYKEAFRKLLLN